MIYQALDSFELKDNQIQQIKILNISIKDGTLFHLQSETVTYGQNQCIISLGKLALCLGNEAHEQYSIQPKRVKQLLFSGVYPIVDLGYIIEDIVVGVLESDWNNENPSLEDTNIEIISGRHRHVVFLTLCHYNDILEEAYLAAKIRIVVKVFKTYKAMAETIIATNDCRYMPKSEDINLIFLAAGANDIKSICKVFDSHSENSKLISIKLADCLTQCLNLTQKKSKNFKVGNKLVLESTLRAIATRYISTIELPKSEQNSDTLMKLSSEAIKQLPAIFQSITPETYQISKCRLISKVVDMMTEVMYF